MTRTEYIKKIMQSFQEIKRLVITHKHLTKCENDLPPPSQMGIILHLLQHKRTSIKNMATALQISSSAATQLIDNLEARKLVIRTQDPDDKRSVRIQLTPKAIRMHEKIETACAEPFMHAFNALSKEELETYLQLQTKIITHIHEKN